MYSPPASPNLNKSVAKSGAKKEELDAKAWLQRRRQQIAKASRKAREKRKQAMDELKKDNAKLRQERMTFLNKINELQAKVNEMRSNGECDVQLENELLRAQLQEHKRFLGSCFKLHYGIPSSNKTRQNLNEQASSFAETYVQSLLSRSSVEQDWVETEIPTDHSKYLKKGFNCTGIHKFVHSPAKCLHLRFDLVFRDVSIDTVANVYWSMWTNPDYVRKMYSMDYPFQLTKLNLPESLDAQVDGQGENSGSKIGTMCHLEKRDPPEKDCEWVFVVSRKKQSLAKSTLTLSKDKTPSILRGAVDNSVDCGAIAKPEKVDQVPAGPKRKKRKVKSKDQECAGVAPLGTFGKTPAWILTRSTTQHVQSEGKEGAAQRITGMLLEGAIAWEQGVIKEEEELEASFVDNQQNEQLVEKQMCTRLTVVGSVPEKVGLGILPSMYGLIAENGTVAPLWYRMFEQFYEDCVKFEKQQRAASVERGRNPDVDYQASDKPLINPELTVGNYPNEENK